MSTPGTHALLSPSAASRWLNCTPAPRLEAELPEKTSEYAAEGTLAHSVCELFARKKFTIVKPSTHNAALRKMKKQELWNDEMQTTAATYVDHLMDKAEVYNTYGPSETTVCASYYRCNGGTVLEDGTYPIGHPVKGAEIRILDQNGAEVPAGETGEICIYGGGVSLGYIGDHAEENKAFAVLSDGSAMYRSGDLGYLLPNGDIAFLHRKDTQIMIYGKRVEVAEVESRLYQCKNVQQAVVRAFTDEDGLSYMTAYVVPANQDMRVSAVRKELLENLTSFMIPEFIVKMPQIPLNTNGKPDVSRLPVVMKAGSF